MARHSRASRLALLASLCLAARYAFGPSFSVKGSWEGTVGDVSNLPNGLGPKSVSGVAFEQEGLSLAAADGHLKARYQSGPMAVSFDDSQAWQANFTQDGTRVHVKGHGSEDMSWAASRQSSVEGLGDVEMNVSSDSGVGVSLSRDLPEVAGVHLHSSTRSNGEGVLSRLEAQRELGDFNVHYAVENAAEGDYALANLKHNVALGGSHKDGSFDASLRSQSGEHLYNVTYGHDLSALLRGGAGVVVGADNAGLYGQVHKGHSLGSGYSLDYDAHGRSDTSGDDRSFHQALRLSNELGSLRLSHGSTKAPQADLELGIQQRAARLDGRLGYALGANVPTFNLTVSSDLAQALDKLDAQGELQIGIDDASVDGLYARVEARRQLGKNLALAYSSQGRAKALEHSLKVSNDFGFAEIVHAGDEPRVRLGYQFDA